MKTYLMALGFYIWKSIVTGCTTPTSPPMDMNGENVGENQRKNFGTKFKTSMKAMTRSRRIRSILIEDSLRV
jgi:hypothetical protein